MVASGIPQIEKRYENRARKFEQFPGDKKNFSPNPLPSVNP